MKSIKDEVLELEADQDAAQSRIAAIAKQLPIATFEGSEEQVARLKGELASERESIRDLRERTKAVMSKADTATQELADLERTVFSLATGALALSVTFSDSLIPVDPKSLDSLRAAWILLTTVVITFLVGRSAQVIDSIGYPPRWLFKFLSNILPGVAFACFGLGVLSFLEFALGNLPAK